MSQLLIHLEIHTVLFLLARLIGSIESQQKIPDSTPSKNIVLLGNVLLWRKHLLPSHTCSILPDLLQTS